MNVQAIARAVAVQISSQHMLLKQRLPEEHRDDRKLDPEPTEQAAIRVMRELRQQGIAYAKIGAELESKGFHGRNGQRLYGKVVRSVVQRAG